MMTINQRLLTRLLAVVIIINMAGVLVVNAQTGATALQCEHLTAPIGIDASLPRLSWQMADKKNGSAQTACQVMVSNDSISLTKKHGIDLEFRRAYNCCKSACNTSAVATFYPLFLESNIVE